MIRPVFFIALWVVLSGLWPYQSLNAQSNYSEYSESCESAQSYIDEKNSQRTPDPQCGIKIVGDVLADIAISERNLSHRLQSQPHKQVKFFRLDLSNEAKAVLIKTAERIQKDRADISLYASKPSANKIDLGMNKVPVFDQGIYGTCTVFVATAALDALMNAGDFISQQCLLELGVALQNQFVTSGWNGAWGSVIFNRIENYGVISQKNCPHQYADPNAMLSNSEYLNLSNKLWSTSFKRYKLAAKDLDSLKNALNKGHRVLISTAFHKDYINGDSINGYRYGLWSLPSDLKKFIREINNGSWIGHSSLVIGYDDQTELLKIRNSWGAKAGVKGNYYMTYEYYKFMNMDAIEVF